MAFWFPDPMNSIATSNRTPLALRFLQARLGWQIVLALLVAAVCFLAFSARPPEQLSTGWDKLNHGAAFAALTMTALLAFPRRGQGLWWVLLGLLAFGGLIEVVQGFVPSRSSEWADLLADSVGIVAGTIVTWPLLSAAYPRR